MKRVVISLIIFAFWLVLSSLVHAQSLLVEPGGISERIKIGDFIEIPVSVNNPTAEPQALTISVQGDIRANAKLNKVSMELGPGEEDEFVLTLFGHNETIRDGSLSISGNTEFTLPINFTVSDFIGKPVDALRIKIDPVVERVKIGEIFDFKIELQNLLQDKRYNLTLLYSIDRLEDDEDTFKYDKAFFEESETVELGTAHTIVKNFDMPDFIRPGRYVINAEAKFLGLESSASRTFFVVEPFLDHMILGILPVRWALFSSFFVLLAIGGYIYYRRRKAKQKRYTVKIDYKLLPKPGPRSIWLGYIAETKIKAYYELETFTVHSLIAGSTGGGKTVSAEVIVEEALDKGVSVIVFDPTAQWSGFLRRNTQKKMFDIYRRFNMKKTDAKAYNGNVRQILDAREMIDIKKYMKPGEINVFTINRLDPEDADVLVSNTIRQVFHANLPESPVLKLMIIFDEVHRLLPKFGGSGQGFVQIERGAREFRKWGVGLMLISQVLKDFVGETKANINTEIQMRTRDQGDLERIKGKYGGYMLQSLLKSATGTGMIENANYNKGNPYFIAFRPLKHMHARLEDKELDQFNKYNDMLDDIEYQIDQLEEEKIDVFDLRLEHKMALDKVKSGSFNMVDIYLEGLQPRVKQQWDKLGKAPKKLEKKLVSEDELNAEFAKAKEAREAEGAKDAAAGGGGAAPKGPLKMGDGMFLVTSKQELFDALGAMDDGVFAKHVNDEKNEIADWMLGEDQKLGEKLKTLKSREEMMKAVEEVLPKN